MVQSTRNTSRHLQRPARGETLPAPAPARHADLIEQSHLRCSAFGLTRIERPEYEPMMRGDLVVARERNQRLFAHAAPVMEMLFEQIAGTESMIVLTDAQGTILHSVGDDDFLGRASKVALAPGVNWAEHSKGTNAIGTALFEAMPTLVHAGEHFMHANHFLTCSAAPIFDPRGDMLGVLDVSGDQRSFHQHTMGLVRMSARMIENHWLCDDNSNRLRLHFHSRVEFIGTLLEGILVIGDGGRILGANHSALDQLNLSTVSLRAHTLTSLFGTSVATLSDHFRSPLQLPLQLSVPSGARFHVHARAHWAARPAGGGALTGSSPAAVDGTSGTAPAFTPPPPPGHAVTAPEVQAGLKFLQCGDAQVEAVVQKARRIIDRDIALLILGETGTGKELLARAVHQDSSRAKQAFVVVNCASIGEAQLELELFGSEEGAFDGARRKGSQGRIVQANGGTLFLDQIDAMPLAVQARLLRVLQERSVTPLGGQRPIPIDIALITATPQHLRELIRQQQFREDLYYRLNGLALRLPPLRERTDLPALAQRILQTECPNGTPEISAPVMSLFRRCTWPGNVRQLANVLRTAAVMAGGEALITEAHLSDDFIDDAGRHPQPATLAAPASARGPAGPAPRQAREATLEETELELVRSTLAATQGNISEASKRLGVSRNTIYRKLRRVAPGKP